MKAAILAVPAMIFLAVSCCSIDAADNSASAQSREGSIYSYSEDDLPEIFFFPKEKARWDGSRVTMKEWYTLTELQKEKFISEYADEMKKQYGHGIEIVGLDYLRALNVFSYYSDDRKAGEPSTKFIDRMLAAQGKISGNDKGVQGETR